MKILTLQKRLAIVLSRMYSSMTERNDDTYFFGEYADICSPRQIEYIKKYLRNTKCLTSKVVESHFFDGISAVWKVDRAVFMSLYRQYEHYMTDDVEKELQSKPLLKKESLKNSKAKHISLANRIINSKLRKHFYVSNYIELVDAVKERYPQYQEALDKLDYINEHNKPSLPKMRFNVNYKEDCGLLSKVKLRYVNSLVSLKVRDTNERELFCQRNGLNYEFDVTSSIYTTTYLLNNNELPSGDLYKQIYQTAFPDKKCWTAETRQHTKDMMMRCYFGQSKKTFIRDICNDKYTDKVNTMKRVGPLYDAMRTVIGQTYDSEIFFHESCIMINVIYRLMAEYQCNVFAVYDGIYFDKPVDAESIWKEEALKYADIVSHYCTSSRNKLLNAGLSLYPFHSTICHNSNIPVTIVSSIPSINRCTVYTLTDNLGVSPTRCNNVKRYLSTFDADNSISLTEYERRQKQSNIQKGVKHNSENMKGVKHSGKNNHYIVELEKYGLVNITDDNEFRAKAYAAGLPKSKVCRLLKFKKETIDNV